MKCENTKVAIVLGGTNPHIQLINKLKARGYYTVLIDYYPNPPAKAVADEHIQESTMDKELVLDIAKKVNAKLVITTNIDRANITACYVAEKLSLPHPYSYETALNVTDKSRMKQIMWENEIPTSKYIVVDTIEDTIKQNISYPAVIKPVDSNGSRGVYKINNKKELHKFFHLTKKASLNKQVVIEDYVEGVEVSFYYYIQNGVAYFIDGYQRYNFKTDKEDVIQSTGVVFPAGVSKKAYSNMHIVTNDIAKAFMLNNTPLFVQAVISGDDVYVLEFAPRIGGGLSYRVIERDCHFDLIDAAIDSFEGNEVKVDVDMPDYYSGILNIYAPGITMGEIKGVEDILDRNVASEFYRYKMKGASISADMSSGSRAGAFLIHAQSIEEIRKRVLYINDNVEVYDIDGNKAMRHDVYDVWKEKK